MIPNRKHDITQLVINQSDYISALTISELIFYPLTVLTFDNLKSDIALLLSCQVITMGTRMRTLIKFNDRNEFLKRFKLYSRISW